MKQELGIWSVIHCVTYNISVTKSHKVHWLAAVFDYFVVCLWGNCDHVCVSYGMTRITLRPHIMSQLSTSSTQDWPHTNVSTLTTYTHTHTNLLTMYVGTNIPCGCLWSQISHSIHSHDDYLPYMEESCCVAIPRVSTAAYELLRDSDLTVLIVLTSFTRTTVYEYWIPCYAYWWLTFRQMYSCLSGAWLNMVTKSLSTTGRYSTRL